MSDHRQGCDYGENDDSTRFGLAELMAGGGASIYRRDDEIYVIPQPLTQDGVRVFAPPIEVVHLDDTTEVLGAAALDAIRDSTSTIPIPDDPKRVALEMLEPLGFTSLAEFERGARLVVVFSQDDQIGVQPSKARGRGFVLTKPRFCAAVPTELGEEILQALKSSVAARTP